MEFADMGIIASLILFVCWSIGLFYRYTVGDRDNEKIMFGWVMWLLSLVSFHGFEAIKMDSRLKALEAMQVASKDDELAVNEMFQEADDNDEQDNDKQVEDAKQGTLD